MTHLSRRTALTAAAATAALAGLAGPAAYATTSQTASGKAAGKILQPAAAGADAAADVVQTIIDDMEKMHDAPLGNGTLGRETGPGHVIMGNNPRGTNTPGYWQESLDDKRFVTDDYWTGITPWMVLGSGPANRASNTRVEVGTITLNVLKHSTNTWETVQTTPIEGGDYGEDMTGNSASEGTFSRDGDVIRILPAQDRMRSFHGWGTLQSYDTWDIKAVHVSVRARLVVDDEQRGDDRDSSEYVLYVGGDYYPDEHTRDHSPGMTIDGKTGYLPGIGLSRAKRVTNEWQTFNFVTIDTAVQDPGGAISVEELRENPPPQA